MSAAVFCQWSCWGQAASATADPMCSWKNSNARQCWLLLPPSCMADTAVAYSIIAIKCLSRYCYSVLIAASLGSRYRLFLCMSRSSLADSGGVKGAQQPAQGMLSPSSGLKFIGFFVRHRAQVENALLGRCAGSALCHLWTARVQPHEMAFCVGRAFA